MKTLCTKDIENITSSILNDPCLKDLNSYECTVEGSAKPLFDLKFIIRSQINDCFMPFFIESTQSDPIPYPEFIKKALPVREFDSPKLRHFDGFINAINETKTYYEYAIHDAPPFISYISKAIISSDTNSKGTYRNYKYKFFNPYSLYRIIEGHNNIPYFHNNRHLSSSKCRIFYSLFTETTEYPPGCPPKYPLTEKLIHQYYCDHYFNIYLFSHVLNFLNNEFKTDKKSMVKYPHSEKYSNSDYMYNLECLLFVCNLLQESSGINIKYHLFDALISIFLDAKTNTINYFSSLFSSLTDCLKWCANQLIFYNKILYPFIKSLFAENFKSYLKDNFSDSQAFDLSNLFYESTEKILQQSSYKEDLSKRANKISSFSDELPEINDFIRYYALDTFYSFHPTSLGRPVQDLDPFGEYTKKLISYIVDCEFRKIYQKFFFNAGFPL